MTRSVDESEERRWLQLSALCDGEASAREAQESFERWRDDPAMRERWHAYQWVGDVMRSDDLASDAEHDQAFMLALRERLAREPVVLAPVVRQLEPAAAASARGSAVAVAANRRTRWGAPAAMAAGVMAVAGALVVIRSSEPVAPAATGLQAGLQVQSQPARVEVVPVAASGAPAGPMLRSPELDRYLEAHRQFALSPLTAPGGLRQVTAASPEGR